MAKCVFIYGKSGTGKSRSLKNFADDEIFLVQVINKELPFRSKYKYKMISDNVSDIIDQLKKMPCKAAVIDDAGYLMTNTYMAGHRGGKNTYDMFNNIADTMWSLVMQIKYLPDDVIVYLIFHETESDNGGVKLRTIGRLLDEKVCLEGLITICLRCMTDGKRHYFRTQSDGYDITKSPEEMFESIEIENDLKLVDATIRSYYSI